MPRSEEEQKNLDFVLAMYRDVLIAMNPDAVDLYISPDYVQHSSLAPPGVDALKDFLVKIRAESPDAEQTVTRAFADGDYVITHVHVKRWPGDPGLAVADIFRLEAGMIVEHWDVIQEIPAEPVNPNPMV
ncbi:nuclear transport factor 2 family protein [Hyphococcus sp.]|jgi:predicted SnoaL-like aldol condensation-catalyzing enzyme|uniref:nuclear transport factor 2 family protein n=1 Tax=Hyphococcus sp. TaxID=2038636 RepID=UPI003D0C0E78